MSVHYLIVSEVDYGNKSDSDFDIEHPTDCTDHDAGGYYEWTCPEGRYIDEWGVDNLLEAIDEPGRFPFQYWSAKQPGGPWGPEEWDAGLELIEEAPPQQISKGE